MPRHFERHTISFVVRLWVEPMQEAGERPWRGQIEHVGSGETTHFQVPTSLLEFVTAHLPPPGSEAGAIVALEEAPEAKRTIQEET